MSSDVTDRFPHDADPRLKQILEELITNRAVLDELDQRLDTIGRDSEDKRGNTGDLARKRLSLRSDGVRGLISGLERRVRAIAEQRP